MPRSISLVTRSMHPYSDRAAPVVPAASAPEGPAMCSSDSSSLGDVRPRREMRNVVPLSSGFSRASSATIAGLLLLLASCASGIPSPPPLPGAIQETVGAWFDSKGKALPRGQPFVMDVWQGPTHCGWGNLVFLVISWPLGTEVPGGFMSDQHTRMFVRLSTTGSLPASDFASTFEGSATLPTGARTRDITGTDGTSG